MWRSWMKDVYGTNSEPPFIQDNVQAFSETKLYIPC